MKKEINGVEHDFAKVGDIWIGAKPVTLAQYYGWDAAAGKSPVTKLTRTEVLAWCQEHGVSLLTDQEWEDACGAGIIGDRIAVGDVWEEIGGDRRVLRGGSWLLNRRYCRVAFRSSYNPDSRYDHIGFRVCLSSPIDEHEH